LWLSIVALWLNIIVAESEKRAGKAECKPFPGEIKAQGKKGALSRPIKRKYSI